MTWVIGIAINIARTRLRKKTKDAQLTDEEWECATIEGDPEERALLEMACEDALAQLTDEERRIFLLRIINNMTFEGIGARCEMSFTKARRIFVRASSKIEQYRQEHHWR